jgi:hypothetical protein
VLLVGARTREADWYSSRSAFRHARHRIGGAYVLTSVTTGCVEVADGPQRRRDEQLRGSEAVTHRKVNLPRSGDESAPPGDTPGPRPA